MDHTFSDEPEAVRKTLWQFWPLRLIVFFVVLIAAYVGCQLMQILLPPRLTFLPPEVVLAIFTALGIAILITLYRLLVRWTEHRAVTELGAARAVPLFIGGTAIGIVLFCSVIAVIAAYGAATLAGLTATHRIIAEGCAALLAGVGEEIIFRGAVYRLVEEGFGTLVAIIFSGALFGLIHGLNPGATVFSTVAIALEAGILLAAAYALTRSLWLSIGLHFGWNFTEGGIFGAAVSGGKSHGLIATLFNGPDQITGGKFGPEASLPAVAICLIAALVMLVLTIQRGEWKKLRFRFRTA